MKLLVILGYLCQVVVYCGIYLVLGKHHWVLSLHALIIITSVLSITSICCYLFYGFLWKQWHFFQRLLEYYTPQMRVWIYAFWTWALISQILLWLYAGLGMTHQLNSATTRLWFYVLFPVTFVIHTVLSIADSMIRLQIQHRHD